MSLIAACGGAGDADTDAAAAVATSGELPDDIKLHAVWDITGPVAYAGLGASKGAQLAIEEINESAFLGDGVSLSFTETDTAAEIERASSEMTKALADPEIAAILGPVSGQQAAAVAPMIEQSKVPTVFIQAGSDGVVIGDYTFRATAPMGTYYHLAAEHLAAEGLTDVAVLYNGTFPTFAQLGEQVFTDLAQENDLNIVSSDGVQSTTQDFTAKAQAIAAADPDAVAMFLIAPQFITAVTQLRQAGYEGQVLATSVQAAGNVSQAGANADGTIYPVDFSVAMEEETSAAFTAAFTEKYGEEPDPYAAEGYDAVWWIARAIEASGDASHEGIQRGMAEVAADGFEGAMGALTFDGNDMRVEGVLVQWDGTAEQLVK